MLRDCVGRRRAPGRRPHRPLSLPNLLTLLVVAGSARLPASAERLPVATWTSEDGLPHDQVRKILQDSHGFLWFATVEGLGRFDGERFVVYGREQGLSASFIHELIEDRQGRLWVGTEGGGLCRFEPEAPTAAPQPGGRAVFTCAAPTGAGEGTRTARALCEDGSGGLWVGTHAGLYRVAHGDGPVELQPVPLDLPAISAGAPLIFDLARDAEGSLWLATDQGLVRRSVDGRLTHIPIAPHAGDDVVRALLFEPNGRLWLGHQGAGVLVAWPRAVSDAGAEMDAADGRPFGAAQPPGGPRRIELPDSTFSGSRRLAAALPEMPGEARWLIPGAEVASVFTRALERTSDGTIWIASATGALVRFESNAFSWYAQPNGLSDESINTLAEDAGGNLWIGTDVGGTQRILRNGLIAYEEEDGLGHPWVTSISSDNGGRLHVVSGDLAISRLESGRFHAVRPPLSAGTLASSHHYPAVMDHEQAWWFATPDGLYRFPPIARLEEISRATPVARYTSRDGLAGDHIGQVFEDARGDIWVGVSGGAGAVSAGVSRWDRRTRGFHSYDERDGLPSGAIATAFCETLAGDLWIGLGSRGLARWRDGEFLILTATDGIPTANINSLRSGRDGAIWVATEGKGLVRVAGAQGSGPLEVTPFGSAEGLASDRVRCTVEDRDGRLYAGTTKGVDRMEPGAARFSRHYGKADGLPKTDVFACHAEASGTIWFGLLMGLARLDPSLESPATAPVTFIGGVRIAGEAWQISELGARGVDLGSLAADRASIAIDLFGLPVGSPGRFLYQYRLSGTGETWSEPSAERTIHYARLVPGRYRFEARAIGPDSAAAPDPAVVSFTVEPPFWRRAWFLAACVVLVAGFAWLWHRRRVARLVEMERVRTRIATDLHDDVGSSLSQIAILSEVVSRRMTGADPGLYEPLSQIAATSRELVDTMSDIVWSINPQRDQLADLTQRMRRFASDLLSARDVTFRFAAPPGDGSLKLRSELRQQVFLVFKESLNNVARHSGATEVTISLEIAGGRLGLLVTDNGAGFDPEARRDGHGLDSMTRRAARLGGTLAIASRPRGGTTVELSLPT